MAGKLSRSSQSPEDHGDVVEPGFAEAAGDIEDAQGEESVVLKGKVKLSSLKCTPYYTIILLEARDAVL